MKQILGLKVGDFVMVEGLAITPTQCVVHYLYHTGRAKGGLDVQLPNGSVIHVPYTRIVKELCVAK